MNNRPDFTKVVPAVDLARESDFTLGRIEVRPSRRQVVIDGREEAVQPRAMQVLVALARANGAVISRKDLIESCWGGLAVSEDSINQSIGKVRRIAELGGREFEIETIPRVGHKLKGIRPGLLPSEPPFTVPDLLVAVPPAGSQPLHAEKTAAAPASAGFDWSWKATGLAIVLIAIVLALTAWFTRAIWSGQPAPPEQWVVERSEVPIASSLIERHPAISPDGTMIAYSAGTDPPLSRKIYLRRISGGDPLRLTDDPYDDTSPSWSPDGSQIAYAAFKSGEPCRLMIVAALAGSPREVARCRAAARSHVVWSASGKELFFQDRVDANGDLRIMRFDIASGRRGQLTPSSAAAYTEDEPSVSPDGKWIAFCRHLANGVSRRVLVDLRSGKERTSDCNQMGRGYGIAFSEDSKSVFATTKRSDNYAIWAWPVDGTPPSHVLSSPQPMERLSAGPYELLAVEIGREQEGLARSSASGSDKPAYFESENGEAFTPDVSADGTVVAALRRANGAGLWIFPRSGAAREVFALDPDDAQFAQPRWSPDGTRIAISSDKAAAVGIRIVSRSGELLATVPFHGADMRPPAWESDGRSLIFPGLDKNVWRLWRVDLGRGNHLTPLSYTGWIDIRISGHELYGERFDSAGVWRINGNPRRVTPRLASEYTGLWTIAGDEIAYADVSSPAEQVLAQPVAGGASHVLAQIPGYNFSDGFGWDPTSHSLVYVAQLSEDADIELLHLARR